MFNFLNSKKKQQDNLEADYKKKVKNKSRIILKRVKRGEKSLISLKELNISNEKFYENVKDTFNTKLGYIDLGKAKRINSFAIEDIEEKIDFLFLKYLENLEYLYLENCGVKTLESIKELNDLKAIDFTSYESTKELNFLELNKLKNNVVLYLFEFEEINFNDFIGVEKVRKMILNDNKKLSLDGIKKIKNLKDIEINNASYENIKELEGSFIERLDLEFEKSINVNEALKILNDMDSLKVLSIKNCKLLDLEFLMNVNSLEELWFNNFQVDDWSSLNNCKNIKSLYLYNTDITEDILLKIAKIETIENLYLRNSNIETLEPLKKSFNLKNINIWGSKLKDKNIKKELGILSKSVTTNLI
ncbi:MAG: hypothetical protein ACRDD2_13420 [Sarcina sp.]